MPTLAAIVAVAVGALALVGWLTGIDALKSVVPGLLTMKVNTAISFVLLGAGMLLRTRPSGTLGRRAAGVVAITLAMALSAIVGSQYLTGRDIGIDQWLFRELPGQIGTVQPNRMSPMTVVSFLIIGAGLLCVGRRRAGRIAPFLFSVALLVAAVNVLDFIFKATAPSLLPNYTQMALVTAATFVLVSIGALALLPGDGPFEIFVGRSTSATLARRLLVASVVGPIALTWLWLSGEDAGLYGPHYGASLVVLGTIVFLTAVVRQAARSARRSDAASLALLEERDRFFDFSIDMLATADANGYFIRLNPSWTKVLGYALEELCARPFVDFVHPDDRAATNREAARQIDEGKTILNFQNRYRHRDGSYRWLEWTSSPSADGTRLYAAARDVTDRKAAEERFRAPALEAERLRAESRARIQAIIDRRGFRPVFQPIVDLATRATVGYEALTRFDDGGRPDETFAAALESGLGIALERATLEAAVASARSLPRTGWLSLNVSPDLLADVDTMRPLLGGATRPIVLEITEHETIRAYAPLRTAVAALGVELAVDDAGAGVANFNHLVELHPNIVKIDAGLVRGVDTDVSRQAVVAGLVHFASAASAVVIAEGIETWAEFRMVVELGVTLGQGYLLAKPAGVEMWADPPVDISELARELGTRGRGRATYAASRGMSAPGADPRDRPSRVMPGPKRAG